MSHCPHLHVRYREHESVETHGGDWGAERRREGRWECGCGEWFTEEEMEREMESVEKEASERMTREEEFEDWGDGESYCWRCSGTGWIGTGCPDDLCQGGEPGEPCMHGDRDRFCPVCKGRNAF